MRRYSLNGNYCRAAKAAIRNYLRSRGDAHVMLFSLTGIADDAASVLGLKGELFPSLFDYGDLLPPEYTYGSLTQGGDSLVHAYKRGMNLAKHRGDSMLMAGGGQLRHATLFETGD